MLPQIDLELLTRAVDGELSARAETRLRQLLEESAEARRFYSQLLADRDRLRRVPAAAPPADLKKRVMVRVSKLPVPGHITPAIPFTNRPVRKPWIPIAVAASLLFAIGGVSLAYALRISGGNQLANGTGTDRPQKPESAPNADALRKVLPPETEPLASRPTEAEDQPQRPLVPAPRVEIPPKPALEVAVAPRPVPPKDFLTSPLNVTATPFETVQVRLPFLASLSDIKDKAEVREQLLRELQRDPAYRIDLFGHSSQRSLEMVIAAVRGAGLNVHIDGVASSRMKKNQPTTFVVYLESLSATEIRELLARLASADARLQTREFEAVHLSQAQTTDQKELKDLLGIDPGLWKRPDANAANKSVSVTAGTGDAVSRAVASGTAAKGPEKPAVVVVHLPASLRVKSTASREIQHFLAKRGDRKPASVPLMIVVRVQ